MRGAGPPARVTLPSSRPPPGGGRDQPLRLGWEAWPEPRRRAEGTDGRSSARHAAVPRCSWEKEKEKKIKNKIKGGGKPGYLSTAKLTGFFLPGYTLPWPPGKNRDTQAAWKKSLTNMTGGSSRRHASRRLPFLPCLPACLGGTGAYRMLALGPAPPPARRAGNNAGGGGRRERGTLRGEKAIGTRLSTHPPKPPWGDELAQGCSPRGWLA